MVDPKERERRLIAAWEDFDNEHAAALASLRRRTDTHESQIDYVILRGAEDDFRVRMQQALTDLNRTRRIWEAVAVFL